MITSPLGRYCMRQLMINWLCAKPASCLIDTGLIQPRLRSLDCHNYSTTGSDDGIICSYKEPIKIFV